MAPEDVEQAVRILQRLSSGTLDHHMHQRRLVHASGHIVDTRVRVSVVRDADGLVQGLDWVLTDVTE
jgi:PAS domain-containing protein